VVGKEKSGKEREEREGERKMGKSLSRFFQEIAVGP